MNTAYCRLVAGVVALSLGIAGCRRSDEPAVAESAAATSQPPAAAAAGPDAKPGIALTDARLVLPAVAGRPGAAYFTVANGAGASAVLIAVTIEGAKQAEMHETSGGTMTPLASVDVPARGRIAFTPGGRHVMVFGLPASLRAGGHAELTLTFKGGDKISAPLAVQAAGSATADPMAGMTMNH